MKTVSAAEAVALIPDCATLMIGGFMGVGTPERVIDELIGHALTQGIITKSVTVDELFAPSTLALVG